MSDDSNYQLSRLYRGMRQREVIRQDPVSQRVLEARLRPTLAAAASSLTPEERPFLNEPPPRRIGVSMALAIFSQPHIVQTFTKRPNLALIFPMEVMAEALGLSLWELDDLQEEIDRRAGKVLKQATLVSWLRGRYTTEQLFPMLLPGSGLKHTGIAYRNTHLVLTGDAAPLGRSSLHLPWLADNGWGPLTSFRSRYINPNLRREITRGIGLEQDEVDELLERIVTVIPRASMDTLTHQDAWRYAGYAGLTTIGTSYPSQAWVSEPADGRTARWRDWFHQKDGEPRILDPERAFEALLQPRIHGMLKALYGDVLARRLVQSEPFEDELSVFDLTPHIQAVTHPILHWTRARTSATEIAGSLGIELSVATRLLERVHEVWRLRAQEWSKPSHADFPTTPHATWMRRLLRLNQGLRELSLRLPAGPKHRELLFLFAGHFLAESSVDYGQITTPEDAGSVGRALSLWFWPTWCRLLEIMEGASNTTHTNLLVPDSLF